MPIRYGSVCSGIEAATAAWRPLGWEAAWFSEIEQFPCDLLAQKYPEVQNLGDMTKLAARMRAGEIEAPDVLCGGTPCQAFSWAGKRRSLEDDRGQLSLAYVDLFNTIDERREADGREPAVCFWENVPGVLSTKDNAFGCFLGALVGADEPVDAPGGWPKAGCLEGPERRAAWRVLDAQYFGLAQRRKRVFVVASARDGFDPAEVLFECEGLRRGAEAGEEDRQGAAGGAEDRSRADGRPGGLVVLNDQGGSSIHVESAELSPTLTAQQHGHQPCVIPYWCRPDKNSRPVDVSTTLDRNYASPTAHQGGIAVVECFAGGNVQADYRPSTTTTTLDRNAADIRVGRSSGTAIVQTVVPQLHGGSMIEDDKAGTLRSRCVFMGGGGDAALAVVKTVSVQGYGAMREDDKAGTLLTRGCFASCGGDSALDSERGAEHQFAVRRLTVTECERLMGFPDGYTRISYRGRPAEECPDTPRYTALGNSWAVPVVRWIGERLQTQMREANYGDS